MPMRDLNASKLADFVDDECARRLRAYEAQPRDANGKRGADPTLR